MKIQILRNTVIAAALLFSANQGFAQPANTETVKLFYQALSQDKPDLLDGVLAENWEDIPPNDGQKIGRDGFKPFVSGFHKIFSNMTVVNDAIIDAGDTVVVRSTISGTQAGPFAGFESKGKPFSVMAIDIHQFKDGKVVKTWHIENWLSGFFQMGAFK